MNNYIKQLLELIEDSRLKVMDSNSSCGNYTADYEEFDHQFADEFLNGTPERISTIVGIDKYHFPTPDKLNKEQIDKLLIAIESLLLCYNLEFMFPEQVSNQVKYQFIIDQWNSKHVHCKKAVVQIETCKFDERNCPFPDHCKVCESFKCDNDHSHHLDKGLVDFTSMMPSFQDHEEELRDDVDKFKALIKQAQNEDYIAGIHNYCDGRCNKCQFTHKCSSFSFNQELDKLTKDTSQEDPGKEQLMVMLQASSEIIEEELNKRGIDLVEAIEDHEEGHIIPKDKHAIVKQAESYAEKVKRWLESNQIELESRLVSQADSHIQDYFETITWFQLFIPAKVNRAINGLHKDNSTDIDSFDAKGSVKITLIAIDECIVAWSQIMRFIPQKEDSILNLLQHLSKLKRELEDLFPNVLQFIRPGLDE